MDNLNVAISGVYFLFNGPCLSYIGKSTDCRKRIIQHKVNGRKFDHSYVLPCPPELLDKTEAQFIGALRPPENRRIDSLGSCSIDGVREARPGETRAERALATIEMVHTDRARGLLTVEEAAELLNISVSFLNKQRMTGDGPRFSKIGTRVRYRETDLTEWAGRQGQVSTRHNGSA